jgi:hypothetical protein
VGVVKVMQFYRVVFELFLAIPYLTQPLQPSLKSSSLSSSNTLTTSIPSILFLPPDLHLIDAAV